MASISSLSLTSVSLPKSQSLVRNFFIHSFIFLFPLPHSPMILISPRTPRKSLILLPPLVRHCLQFSFLLCLISTMLHSLSHFYYLLLSRQQESKLLLRAIVPTKKDASIFRRHRCRNLVQQFSQRSQFGSWIRR